MRDATRVSHLPRDMSSMVPQAAMPIARSSAGSQHSRRRRSAHVAQAASSRSAASFDHRSRCISPSARFGSPPHPLEQPRLSALSRELENAGCDLAVGVDGHVIRRMEYVVRCVALRDHVVDGDLGQDEGSAIAVEVNAVFVVSLKLYRLPRSPSAFWPGRSACW
jgi:hypothetical protein